MTSEPPPPSRTRIILAGLIGNTMEWYDFAVYGYFAGVVGHLFFPAADPAVSMIAAFGAFAAGFLVRPLGGLLFGRIGDRIGRKRALTLSVIFMAVPTVVIGLLPTYQTIGVLAPILLVAMRIVQGLSVGGEYTSSIVFLVEHARPENRAFTGSWSVLGATAGILLGSGVGALLTALLSDDQVAAWGWRLPFLAGIAVAGTGILIRRAIHVEPPRERPANPVQQTFQVHWPLVLQVAALNVGLGVGFYAAFVYSVTYIKEIDNLPDGIAFNLNTEAMALLLALVPTSAWLADRIGRRPLVIAGAAILTLGAIPFFTLMHSSDPTTIFLGELGFVVSVALSAGGLAAASVELSPHVVRCTALAFAYNASIGLFGGTTPMIAAALIATTGNPIAPAYWVAVAGTVSLLTAIFLMRETRFQPLH